MKKSALVIAAMLAASPMLPAQAPDPMGVPDAFAITAPGQEGRNPGFSEEPQRHEGDRAPSQRHFKRRHRRQPDHRRHADG